MPGRPDIRDEFDANNGGPTFTYHHAYCYRCRSRRGRHEAADVGRWNMITATRSARMQPPMSVTNSHGKLYLVSRHHYCLLVAGEVIK